MYNLNEYINKSTRRGVVYKKPNNSVSKNGTKKPIRLSERTIRNNVTNLKKNNN